MYRSSMYRSVGSLRVSLPCSLGLLFLVGRPPEAWAQKAAYVVQSAADVDGDGRADDLRIDEMGTINISITGRANAGAWTALAASGKVVGGSLQVHRDLDPQGRTIVVATSKLRTRRGRTHQEAVVLAWTPGKLATLWRGAIGSVGQDGAKHISIEVGQYGLIKYASRHGVYRCDGEAAHLDAQRYDFSTGGFRAVSQSVRVDRSSATAIVRAKNRPDDARLKEARGVWFRPQGASSSVQAASAAELVAPLALSDQDDQTAWVENKAGFGRGEFVTLKSSVAAVQVRALRLVLGHGAAPKDFNRPRRLALLLGKTHKFWIELDKDPKGPQWVTLPESVSTDCVTLIIDDVYPPSASKANRGRTAISEISVLSAEDLDPAVAGALLARRIAQGKGGADLTRLLRAWGSAATQALVSAIANTKDERAILRLRLALARIPAAADQLVAGLASESLRARDLERLRRGLEALGAQAIAPLAEALDGNALGARATENVAGMLAGMPEAEAEQALLRAVGKGNRRQRALVLRALGKRPQSVGAIAAALASSEAGPRQADLYRALGLAAAALPADSPERAALAGQLADALAKALPGAGSDSGASASPTDSSLTYEVQYQILQAAAMIGGEALTSALLAQVRARKHASSAEAIALLRVAVAALADAGAKRQNSSEPAALVKALQGALDHLDPGVRLALVSHLENSTALLPSLARRLREDRWPEVRRALAAALSLHCQESASTSALAEATRQDSDEEVARTALSALVRCQAPGLFPLLLEMVDDKKRPMGVRLYAARQVGAASDRSSSSKVLKRFRRARGLALTERKSGKLASALTVALTDLASKEAVTLLEDSALDPAIPGLQAAAVTALATLCRASSKAIIRDLKRSSDRSVAMAARQAASRCH